MWWILKRQLISFQLTPNTSSIGVTLPVKQGARTIYQSNRVRGSSTSQTECADGLPVKQSARIVYQSNRVRGLSTSQTGCVDHPHDKQWHVLSRTTQTVTRSVVRHRRYQPWRPRLPPPEHKHSQIWSPRVVDGGSGSDIGSISISIRWWWWWWWW